MSPRKIIIYLNIFGVFITLFFLAACSSNYDYDDFSFSVPAGYKTKEFESYTDKNLNAEYLLFTQKGHLYFQIFNKEIPSGSNLDQLFEDYLSQSEPEENHYQLVSQKAIQVENRPAIEYIYRKFHGEPYVQIREMWIENNNQAYILFCSKPADSTSGAIIPVAEECYKLSESFHFK